MEPCRRFSVLLLSTVLCSATAAGGQDLSSLQDLLTDQRVEEVKVVLPRLEKKYPNHPAVLYAKALLTKDGRKASALYEMLIRKYPTSPFADDALFKVAQYQFAQGLYLTARKTFESLTMRYPSSPLGSQAQYFAAQCLLAIGKADSARVNLANLVRQDPSSAVAVLAQKDLQSAATASPAKQVKAAADGANPPRTFYTIQVGAFNIFENALQQWEYFSDRGYPVVIHEKKKGDKTLYLVWVGSFANEDLAKAFGRELKEKWDIPVKVLKRED